MDKGLSWTLGLELVKYEITVIYLGPRALVPQIILLCLESHDQLGQTNPIFDLTLHRLDQTSSGTRTRLIILSCPILLQNVA